MGRATGRVAGRTAVDLTSCRAYIWVAQMFRYQSVGSGSNNCNKIYLARLVKDRLKPHKISPIFLWKKIIF